LTLAACGLSVVRPILDMRLGAARAALLDFHCPFSLDNFPDLLPYLVFEADSRVAAVPVVQHHHTTLALPHHHHRAFMNRPVYLSYLTGWDIPRN
jgi:hypothetical protein